MDPKNPNQKYLVENEWSGSNLFLFQYIMPAIKTIEFTTAYDENESVVASNRTEGPISCFISIPYVENPIGAIIPKNTGTHGGTTFLRFSTKIYPFAESTCDS